MATQPTLKNFVLKVINHRLQLMKKGRGYVSPEFKQEMKNIAYNVANNKNYERLVAYMREKRDVFAYIIPANKKSWKETFESLINIQSN